MEPDLCPPWWPLMLWWVLHHPPRPRFGPVPDPWIIEETEAVLVALHGFHTAASTSDELRRAAQSEAIGRMQVAVEKLSGAIG